MALTTRQLLGRVAPHRQGDLEEAHASYAIQECVRRACRYSQLARELQSPVSILARSQSLTVTPSSSNELIRVERIRMAGVPPSSTYQGTWDANSNVPTMAAASSGNNLQFFIVSVAGTTAVDGVSIWAVGDIIYSNGTAWKRLDRQAYSTVPQSNQPSIDTFRNQAQEATNFPYLWTQEGNTVELYPRLQCDTAIEVLLSYIPVGEIDTIPLPAEAEDTIVAGAIAEILALPGKGQNLKLSLIRESEFKKGLANLRALAITGYGGSAYSIPENFSGRQSRLTPFRSTGGWL